MMFKTIKQYMMALMLSGLLSVPVMAASDISENHVDSDLAFAFTTENTPLDSNSLTFLSEQEMVDTEGEVLQFLWYPAYGLAWGAARATISIGGRFGARWGYRNVSSSKNHHILLRNNQHVLQTGGRRGVSGISQNASHIGWGRSYHGNFSRKHVFYNKPFKKL